jgi:hypothetical protein
MPSIIMDNRSTLPHEEEEGMHMMEVCCKPILHVVVSSAQPVELQDDQDKHQLSDYERLQQDHHVAMEALRQLAQGVRIVTRQMKQQEQNCGGCDTSDSSVASNNNNRARTFSSDTTISVCSSVRTEDDRRAATLQEVMGAGAAADILGLSQAAQMLKEHARLASQEAELLTGDMAIASQKAQDALSRAFHAQKLVTELSRENATLGHQLDQLKMERRVLAKEVKALRREQSALKQFQQDYQRQEMLLALEHHVRGALIVHEEQLAIATKNTLNDRASDEGVVVEKPDPAKTDTKSVAAHKTPSSEFGGKVAPNKKSETTTNAIRLVGGFPATTNAPKTTTRRLSSVGGFGGSDGLAGMAAYKFNQPTVKIPKRTIQAKISLEAPTNATTVVTETNTTPESNPSLGSGAQCNNDKENDEQESMGNQQSNSGDSRSVPFAFSAFLGFLATDATTGSHSSRNKVASSGAKHVTTSHSNDKKTSQTNNNNKNQRGATIDMSNNQEPPLTMNFQNKNGLLLPFAEDSPVSAPTSTGKCDEQVLRSLSLPDEDYILMKCDDDDALSAAKQREDIESAAAAKKLEDAKRSSLRRQKIHALF